MKTVDHDGVGASIKHWRKQSNFSQLELALACDTSSRHLSFVETGRASPSRQLLLRIAETLQIPLRVRNTMLVAAGYAPLFEETGLTAPEMDQIRQALRRMLDKNEPYPSILIDRHWDIIDSNQAFKRMCETFAHDESLLREKPPNLLRLFLNPACIGKSVVNFNEMYTTMVNRARRSMTILRPDDRGNEILQEVLSYRPPELPQIPDDMPRLIMPLHLQKDDAELHLFTMVASLGGPLNITLQEIQLEFALPMDPQSDKFLHQLLEQRCPK